MGDSASEDEHEADGEIDSCCSSCVVEGRPLGRAAISRNRVVPSNKGRAHTERSKRHTEIVKKSLSSAGSVAAIERLRCIAFLDDEVIEGHKTELPRYLAECNG